MGKTSTVPLLLAIVFIFCFDILFCQNIGTFNSVTPTVQTQGLVLPATHTFQRIIKSGDALSAGGTLATNPDFTGFVPIAGSSTNGYLSISSEITPAQVAILDVSFDGLLKKWMVNSGGKVLFPVATDVNGFGETSRFCSGTVTPNNTVIVSEEDASGADNNLDGYIDRGWLIEIDPATRTVINQDGAGGVDKLWAIGRSSHENAAIRNDNQVLYTGADNGTYGYLYKFVPTVPGNFSSGTLYVLQTSAALGTGTWKPVANVTKGERNNTAVLSQAAGAFNFDGIEDVEIGPDGKIYFAAKARGVVYRFTDNGSFGTGTDVSALEIFVGNSTAGIAYDIDGAGSLPPEPWGLGNDNLAFDGDGNLWVLQDAIVSADRNHIWVVRPSHTQASPQVSVFATTPLGSEPTGITFTPDYKFMFISFQHPSSGNTASQVDATGASVIFNQHTTVVIARFENLGAPPVLPVAIRSFNVKKENRLVKLTWTVEAIFYQSHVEIERSADGSIYEKIHSENCAIEKRASNTYNFIDRNYPPGLLVYYRLKYIDKNGNFTYSQVKSVTTDKGDFINSVNLAPSGELLNINYYTNQTATVFVAVFDAIGRKVKAEIQKVLQGKNLLQIEIRGLSKGNYSISISNPGHSDYTFQFSKL